MILELIKFLIKKIIYSFNDNTFYPGVEFYNSRSIYLNKPISIERGTRLHVIQTVGGTNNIIIGEKCWIGRDVEIQSIFDSEIILKSNVSIQDRCKIIGNVIINQDSLLAPDVFLSSGNHFYSYKPELLIKIQDDLIVKTKEDFQKVSKKIVIEEDCWIGKSVIVKSGVVISRGAIVGANSFVNKDIPPYEIWAGNPAKFVKKRLQFEPKYEITSTNLEDYPYFYLGFNHHDMLNGFKANDLSICILGKLDTLDLISLDLNFLNSGTLLVYVDDFQIYNHRCEVGRVLLKQLPINIEEINYKKNLSVDYLGFLQHSLIRFEFISNHNNLKYNFSILNIKIHKYEKND